MIVVNYHTNFGKDLCTRGYEAWARAHVMKYVHVRLRLIRMFVRYVCGWVMDQSHFNDKVIFLVELWLSRGCDNKTKSV